MKRKLLILIITFLIFSGIQMNVLQNTRAEEELQGNAIITESLNTGVHVNNGEKLITLRLRGISIARAIRAVSNKAGFNVVIDPAIKERLNVDFDQVSINKALESIIDTANLIYHYENDTLTISKPKSPLAQSINNEFSAIIPVKYVNAILVEKILKNSIFAADSSDSENSKEADNKISSDYRSNSIVLRGSKNDIRIAKSLIEKIDQPRESKIFKLNYADPIRIASILSSTVFNDGIAPFNSEVEGVKSSGLRTVVESFQEGSGATEVASSDERPGLTIRSKNLSEETLHISPEGPIIVPDTRTNTITIMGTSEQINLASQIVPTLDKKLPQVSIDISLIEVNDNGMRELHALIGQATGQLQLGFNNRQVQGTGSGNPAVQRQGDDTIVQQLVDPITGFITTAESTIANAFGRQNNIIGIPTIQEGTLGGVGAGLAFTTNYLGKNSPHINSADFLAQVNFLVTNRKAKLLSNPSVIAVHDTEAVVSMVDEIVRSSTVTRDATGFQQTQTEIGEAGIILNILPKIAEDKTVNLRLRPSVSFIKEIVRDPVTGGITTLLTRRDMAFQEIRIDDGSTLIISGLTNDSSSETLSKVPFLGDLPIIGALFRSSENSKRRSELVLLVTPHILDDNGSPMTQSQGISLDMPSKLNNDQSNRSDRLTSQSASSLGSSNVKNKSPKEPKKIAQKQSKSVTPRQSKKIAQKQSRTAVKNSASKRIASSHNKTLKKQTRHTSERPADGTITNETIKFEDLDKIITTHNLQVDSQAIDLNQSEVKKLLESY